MAIFNTVPPLKAGPGIKFDGERISTAAAPRNWLDNSDFTNLVAQAGIGGKHGNVAYAADRWILTSGTVEYTTGVGLKLNGTITQRMERVPDTPTCFIGMTAGTATISINGNEVTITSAGGVIKWAAVYDGAYTTETLPEYQPKGYMCELLECKRYYQAFANNAFLGTGVVTNNYVQGYIATDVQMRVKPTLVGTIGVYNGDSTTTASELRECANQGCGFRVNLVLISNLVTSALCIYAQSQVSFSADL